MQEGKPYKDKPRKRTMGVINDAIGMKKQLKIKAKDTQVAFKNIVTETMELNTQLKTVGTYEIPY